jgi:uncharacterized C2H2 Zn-finger protein
VAFHHQIVRSCQVRAVLDRDETLPLSCPKCHGATEKPIPWVQENTFFTCPSCGGFARIDKDAAMKLLAQLHHPVE